MPPDLTPDSAVDRYAVMGNPVSHSKSPLIHAAFAEQTGQSLRYDAILVEPGGFTRALEHFQSRGGRGVNVTLPFKFEAAALTEPTARAAEAGAVNTIWFGADGRRHGDNTDGEGLIADLLRHGVPVAGRRVLILGAGGAVAGVLPALLARDPARITIANRTLSRARELQARFPGSAQRLEVRSYDELAPPGFDLIINGTSLSLHGEVPPLPASGLVAAGTCCYDMAYADGATPFVSWARQQGAGTALDGLGMLVEQAAESFLIWRGVRPETGPVIRMLREKK